MSNKALLKLAIDAAYEAGKNIRMVYNTAMPVPELKGDGSPVTNADRLAHETIQHILKCTDFPILSEEGQLPPYSERRTWSRFWLVDPLDGTKDFIKRTGDFSVNIALIENSIPVLGVVYVPATDVLYFACRDSAAFRLKANVCDMLPTIYNPEIFSIVVSRSHINDRTLEYIEACRKIHERIEIIRAGSALKFCLVAEGTADCYPRFAPTKEWDSAAGQIIVELAGGRVIDQMTGVSMIYNRANLENNSFVAERGPFK